LEYIAKHYGLFIAHKHTRETFIQANQYKLLHNHEFIFKHFGNKLCTTVIYLLQQPKEMLCMCCFKCAAREASSQKTYDSIYLLMSSNPTCLHLRNTDHYPFFNGYGKLEIVLGSRKSFKYPNWTKLHCLLNLEGIFLGRKKPFKYPHWTKPHNLLNIEWKS